MLACKCATGIVVAVMVIAIKVTTTRCPLMDAISDIGVIERNTHVSGAAQAHITT